MTDAKPSGAAARVVDFLGDVGSRWGLPPEACRVHGYLYLNVTPLTEAELRAQLGTSEAALEEAVAWLADYRLIERTHANAWRSESDPWELMMRALQERQRREIGPALELLRDCRRAALAEGKRQSMVAVQIDKLLRLVEDLAAISRQAQRLSPAMVRQMVGFGGLAVRLLDRTLSRRERS